MPAACERRRSALKRNQGVRSLRQTSATNVPSRFRSCLFGVVCSLLEVEQHRSGTEQTGTWFLLVKLANAGTVVADGGEARRLFVCVHVCVSVCLCVYVYRFQAQASWGGSRDIEEDAVRLLMSRNQKSSGGCRSSARRLRSSSHCAIP